MANFVARQAMSMVTEVLEYEHVATALWVHEIRSMACATVDGVVERIGRENFDGRYLALVDRLAPALSAAL